MKRCPRINVAGVNECCEPAKTHIRQSIRKRGGGGWPPRDCAGGPGRPGQFDKAQAGTEAKARSLATKPPMEANAPAIAQTLAPDSCPDCMPEHIARTSPRTHRHLQGTATERPWHRGIFRAQIRAGEVLEAKCGEEVCVGAGDWGFLIASGIVV